MQEEKQQGSAADGAAHIAQGAQAAYSVISAARAGSTAAGAAVGTATAGPLGTVVGFLVTTKTFWKILGAVFAAILLFLFDMIAFAVATGMSQGVLPLIAYNFAAKNYRRMMKSIKVDFAISLSIAVIGAILLFTCAAPIVRAFIDDEETIRYGQLFQRIICITGPFISVTMLSITCFQSVGKKLEPSILSLLRKGGLDIPFMFLMDALIGIEGIVWATPIADLTATTVAVILFVPFWRKLSAEIREQESTAKLPDEI